MATVHQLLRKYAIRPRKRLGQHFLAAGPTIDKIVDALEIVPEDTVLEIGPGLGVMTRRIAGRAGRVVAVDQDERMVDICRSELADTANVEVVQGDILEFDLARCASAARPIKVAGNLPYNISSPIIFWMLDASSLISSAVIMLQREVAERIAAKPGGKDYGTLSVMVQAQAEAKVLFSVSAASFVPPPDVASAVLRIDFPRRSVMAEDMKQRLGRAVRAAFGKRRKTIRNALLGAESLGLDARAIDSALEGAGINPGSRPEQVPVKDYIRLAQLI